MLDIKVIRENPEDVKKVIARRNMSQSGDLVDRLLDRDRAWRDVQTRVETLRGRRNDISAKVKNLPGAQRQAAIEEMKLLKGELSTLEESLDVLKGERDQLLSGVPNILASDVPDGCGDENCEEVGRWGERTPFNFAPRDHVELGQITDTIDFERAGRVAGSGFYFLKREGVMVSQALCAFATMQLSQQGFIPLETPDLARRDILEGIGFAPRGPEKQVYNIEESDLSLIGTAEITIGGYHSGEILRLDQLPSRYLGLSHCFRTEAGAHGKESKGLYRVHQFTKAEMFIFCTPEQSSAEHERLRHIEESLLQALEIPYRVLNICAGDLGAPAAKKYDLEAWMPGRNIYGEVTSCSNCTDYQARRLNIRYRPSAEESPRFVHMLNGTAIAVSRTMIAIYENYQRVDGSIAIPKVLQPWMGGIEHIPVRS